MSRQKAQNFVHFGHTIWFKFYQHVVQNTYQIICGDTLDFQCQHWQRAHVRVIMANSPQKLLFRSDILCYHYWCWHWKASISIHYLIGNWTTCWWNNGYTFRTTLIFGTLNLDINLNRLAFSLQKRLLKWRQRFVKNGFKMHGFLFLFCLLSNKAQNSCRFDQTILYKIHKHVVYKRLFRNVWRDLDFQCQH